MKTTIFTLILLSICISINCQNKDLNDLIIYNNTSKNENGTVREYIQYDKSISRISGKSIYTFDSTGTRTQRIHYIYKNNTWVPVHKYDYVYNDHGQVSNVIYTKWNKRSDNWAQKSENMIHIYKNTGELLAVNKETINNDKLLSLK